MNTTTSMFARLHKRAILFLIACCLQCVGLLWSNPAAGADVDTHFIDWFFRVPASNAQAQYVTQKLLPQLIGSDDKLRTQLGFSSLSQIPSLGLPDPPFAVFRIGLTKLQTYDPTMQSSLWLLLEKENWFDHSPAKLIPVRLLFPIRESSRPPTGCRFPSLVDIPGSGCVSSSVQVKLVGNWEFQQIGRPRLIKKLNQYGNGATHFAVWIPVMNLHYLGRIDGSEIVIKAIANDSYVININTGKRFAEGEELPGKDVFGQLKVMAQRIKANDPPG